MPTPTLPPLSSARTVPASCELLAVGWTGQGPQGLPPEVAKVYAKQVRSSLAQVARSLGAGTDVGAILLLPAVDSAPALLVVGLGEYGPAAGPEGHEQLRLAAGSAARAAGGFARDRAISVAVSFGVHEPAEVRAVSEGILLGAYAFRPHGARQGRRGELTEVSVVSSAGRVAAAELTAATKIATAVATAREWVNTPPNALFPASLAEEAASLAAGRRIDVEVLDEQDLARGGYGGLLAVGGGSDRPPRLVRLRYAPRGASAHLALVGKGITFDSGGLNLKPGDSMYTMKADMSGAAAVLAAVAAIADLNLKVNVTAYGALAENLPSGTAFRPSDVLTIYGGTTVENGNSDAEGRLVLADGIVRAAEDRPDMIVDVATLTGACVTALGERTAGLVSSDDTTADRVLAAARAAGEALWRLPIPGEIPGKLESKVADLKSTGDGRAGGALLAAAFLREFVPEGVGWAHLDIAGPAFFTGSPYGYVRGGGTGYAVRTLVALAGGLVN